MKDIVYDRSELFNLSEPISIPTEEFEGRIWPLISNVWTQLNQYKSKGGDITRTFVCRLLKHRESSTRQEEGTSEGSNIKRRLTYVRESQDCQTKIKITHFANQTTLIERVRGTPDHSHPLQDSDRLKRPKVIRDMIQQEASKAYKPPAIVDAIKDLTTDQGLEELNPHIRRKEVANIQATVRTSQLKSMIGDENLGENIKHAVKFLKDLGYVVEGFSPEGSPYQGFFFATKWQLEKLAESGWLTLMDSTFNTNRFDWRLFTLYVRDKYNSWCIGAHFLVSGEEQVVVGRALKIIRRYTPKWQPRYFLCDNSSVEDQGIRKAFPGISKGEQNCDVILCTVHVMRAWMRNISCDEVKKLMIQAMFKKTKIGCEELIQRAIQKSPYDKLKNYIRRNYAKNTEKWALHARQHSALLLQVSSTNALESYHSELKRLTSRRHGIIGEQFFFGDFYYE